MKSLLLLLLLCGTAKAEGPWSVAVTSSTFSPYYYASHKDHGFIDLSFPTLDAGRDFVYAMNQAHERRTQKKCIEYRWEHMDIFVNKVPCPAKKPKGCIVAGPDEHGWIVEGPCTDDPGAGLTEAEDE